MADPTLGTALPYGMRDCKFTPYTDALGSVLGSASIDLPNIQTLSFSETEEFQELRGDDKVVTTRGKGAQVEWELEAGGYSMKVWAILTGGSVDETGAAGTGGNPGTRKVTLRKRSTQARPFFRIEGQAISDSGGDIHVTIFRARCNSSIDGKFGDGEFFITSAKGLGLPMPDDTGKGDFLYEFVQNEVETAVPLTPVANPVPTP